MSLIRALRKLFPMKSKVFYLSKEEFFQLSYEKKIGKYTINNARPYQHLVEDTSKRIQSSYLGQIGKYCLFIIIEDHLETSMKCFRSEMYNWEEVCQIKVTLDSPAFRPVNLKDNYPREIVFFLPGKEKITLTFDDCGIVRYGTV